MSFKQLQKSDLTSVGCAVRTMVRGTQPTNSCPTFIPSSACGESEARGWVRARGGVWDIQVIATYNEAQETLALLKILALGKRKIEEGKLKPIGKMVKRLRTGY